MDELMYSEVVENTDMPEEMTVAEDCGCAYGAMEEGDRGDKEPKEACRIKFFQKEKVSVPVKVTPFAVPGEAKVTCCGRPMVISSSDRTEERTHCMFKVTQALCIEIPISFGAKVETGEIEVQCGIAGTEECDCK
ncbi:MAG: hypothetical protein IJZ84_01495 [Lachnospiraceae bacterium]|nr:hypothetical protein [Lachnospiraceae bacterium]